MEAKKQSGFGKKLIGTITRNPIVFLLVIAAIVVGCLVDNFFSWANLSNLMSNTAIRFLIALGVRTCPPAARSVLRRLSPASCASGAITTAGCGSSCRK